MVLKVEHIKVEERGHVILLELLYDDVGGYWHISPFRHTCNKLGMAYFSLTGSDRFQLLEKARNLVLSNLVRAGK